MQYLAGVLALHVLEHLVAATLDRDVQEFEDARMIQDARHLLHVLENMRWICHAKTKHNTIWEYVHYVVEQLRQWHVNVLAVSACVF
jgi:hypothetical protein